MLVATTPVATTASRHLLVIDPKQRLAPDTTGRLTVSTGVRDLAGNRLAETKTVTFTTD